MGIWAVLGTGAFGVLLLYLIAGSTILYGLTSIFSNGTVVAAGLGLFTIFFLLKH